MSAPSGTVWGSEVIGGNSGRKGKIGIYVTVSESTKTSVKFRVQVWFWSIYSCYDGSNTLKFNSGDNVTSASTPVTHVENISHNTDTGSGWSTNNQTLLYTFENSEGYIRRHTDRVIKFYASFSGIDMLNGTMYVNTRYTILKKDSYKITFNANGGSNAPSSQTKWYGETLTLSSTKPTRTGYTFLGWGTSSSSTSVAYSAGGSYTKNESDTLYAVWKANTYPITFDANGGSGGPTSQTKTYGVTLVLSSTIPTRTNYNFEGWSTSSTATSAEYSAGGNYIANTSATLYAVWSLAYSKPRITNFSARRVNANDQFDDQGTTCKVVFDWATDNQITAITVSYRQISTGENWSNTSLTAQGTSGSVNQNLFPEFSVDTSYEIKVTVADGADSSYSSYVTQTLSSGKFLLDFKAGGDGIAIGKAAENAGFDIYMDANFEKRVAMRGDGVAIGKVSENAGFDVNMDTNFEKSVTMRGEIEIYGSQPHLDFHYNNSTEDYTSRIIEMASGRLNLSASNGVLINNKKTENEAVTLTVNANRITDLSYTAKYNELLGAVFVRIYGKINATMSVGYGYTLFNIGSHLPNAVAALSVKIGSDDNAEIAKKAAAYAKSNGTINIQPFDSELKGYDIYITGFWFV